MFNDEELQFMHPRMSIEYRVEEGFLSSGSFDNIPENAYGAHIGVAFPVVGANGEFRLAAISYDLFVGKSFKVNELLNVTTVSKEQILEYEKNNIKQVVLTKTGVRPLNDFDAVFPTQEEMVQAITKINETFKSVTFSVQNSETPTIHR